MHHYYLQIYELIGSLTVVRILYPDSFEKVYHPLGYSFEKV